MSLLLLSKMQKTKDLPGLVESDGQAVQQIRRNRVWLLTYIALFTALLAFFIFLIVSIELESSTPKRNYQKLVKQLYLQLDYHKQQQGLAWLQLENTLTKGVRLTLPPDLVANQSLFESARAKINPRYLPYLTSVAEVIKTLDLEGFKQRHQKLVQGIEAAGYEVQLQIRIEGHTDSNPMAPTARFRDNVELSTFRAYAMMEWLRIHSGLPKPFFSMAGYGSFHPLTEPTSAAENRRVEIYILPLVKAKPGERG